MFLSLSPRVLAALEDSGPMVTYTLSVLSTEGVMAALAFDTDTAFIVWYTGSDEAKTEVL